MKINKPFLARLPFAFLVSGLLGLSLLPHLYNATMMSSIQADNMIENLSSSQSTAPLCQFGVNAVGSIGSFDTAALRMGWYVNYTASATPINPNGAEYVPIIRLSQVGENGYDYSPNGSALQSAIANNLGAAWIIGNEPDRPGGSQDNIEPHVYAYVYHELYDLIKTADPKARIFAGAIVQPTPVRLQYLDMILDAYQNTYGEPMPVDGWSIHNFILNEVSCDLSPERIEELGGCWGAEIPPGVNVEHGELVAIDDNDNITLFIERIEIFRQWMIDRGYGGLPVYLSEYGVLMPEDYGYPSSRVNAFMNGTFDYLLNATNSQLGDPNDNYRLIQRWSWYSTDDKFFNGWLFDPITKQISVMGSNYADYVAQIADQIDLYPSQIFTVPAAPFSQGENITTTLQATIANSGNLIAATNTVTVQFYENDPDNGGVQIGADQSVSLSGCGDNETVSVAWNNVSPGAHQIFVKISPATNETNTLNNISNQTVLVATHRVFLPIVRK